MQSNTLAPETYAVFFFFLVDNWSIQLQFRARELFSYAVTAYELSGIFFVQLQFSRCVIFYD